MCLAALTGHVLRLRLDARAASLGAPPGEGDESYIVSAVAGLLALLLGFTFSIALDRFDARRVLVLEEANAIGTTYLRAQLLEEPHRTHISRLVHSYADNRLALAQIRTAGGQKLLERNDALLTELWSATVDAWDSIKGYDFSDSFLETMNHMIDLDASRKAARAAHVPPAIFAVLFVYMTMTAGLFGYAVRGARGRRTAPLLLALFAMALMLIVDVDRPLGGRVIETQRPMEALSRFLADHPPGSFGGSAPPQRSP